MFQILHDSSALVKPENKFFFFRSVFSGIFVKRSISSEQPFDATIRIKLRAKFFILHQFQNDVSNSTHHFCGGLLRPTDHNELTSTGCSELTPKESHKIPLRESE
jgi:hypothetical protein